MRGGRGGARLARKLVPGEWALIRAPDGDQYPDFYLGKGVCRNEWGGGCALEYKGSTQSQLGPQKVRFDNGDFQVVLQVQIPKRDTQPSSPPSLPVLQPHWASSTSTSTAPATIFLIPDHQCPPASQLYKAVEKQANEGMQQRKHYQREKVALTVANSANLVATGSALVSLVGGSPPLPRRPPRSADGISKEATDEGQRTYELSLTAEACALRACM